MRKKLLTIILLLLSVSLFAQNGTAPKATVLTEAERKELNELADVQKKDYEYVTKYVIDVKLKELEKGLPKVEKNINLYKRKFNEATKKSTKARYKKLLEEEEKKLVIIKLWKGYRKFYLQYKKNEGKNFKLFQEGLGTVLKIEAHYKKITSKDFPNPEATFKKSSSGKKLLKIRADRKNPKSSKKKK